MSYKSLSPTIAMIRLHHQGSRGHLGHASLPRILANPTVGGNASLPFFAPLEKTEKMLFQLLQTWIFFISLSRWVILRKGEKKLLVTSGVSHTYELHIRLNHSTQLKTPPLQDGQRGRVTECPSQKHSAGKLSVCVTLKCQVTILEHSSQRQALWVGIGMGETWGIQDWHCPSMFQVIEESPVQPWTLRYSSLNPRADFQLWYCPWGEKRSNFCSVHSWNEPQDAEQGGLDLKSLVLRCFPGFSQQGLGRVYSTHLRPRTLKCRQRGSFPHLGGQLGTEEGLKPRLSASLVHWDMRLCKARRLAWLEWLLWLLPPTPGGLRGDGTWLGPRSCPPPSTSSGKACSCSSESEGSIERANPTFQLPLDPELQRAYSPLLTGLGVYVWGNRIL
jgi:hypothetical protein